ncbi:prolyl oligopeptidase family serine peptidase [Streptomyces olivoreticuli]|uniref:prolyl oligopeptidase family serine peptidase n=1 Tax=Streptomyces olivoreticuli TaxID=68246 RepID=UPI00265A21E4|nr:prolyl oligopeptidase family serine peptidase [Streptomyces olivoreticuli]WKK23963.1 prolyl oligopeptidase family serine peptidase [Streptomyces olivoreticuli]
MPARRQPADEEIHGRLVPDPFRWLEDDTSAECEQWLRKQQRVLARHAAAWRTEPLFRALLGELTDSGGAVVPVVSSPVLRGRRRFFLRRCAGQDLPVLFTALDGEDAGAEHVVLDPMRLDPSGRTILSAWRPSWSGRLLAFQVASGGAEEPVLQVLDVTDGQMVGQPLAPGLRSPIAWLADDTGFYYVTGGPTEVRRVRLHRIGDDGAHDPVVFETQMRHLSVSLGPEGRWLTVSAAPGAQTGNILHLADLADLAPGPAGPRGPAAPEFVRVHDGTADGSSALIKTGPRGLLYGITNAGAPLGRVCLIDPADPRSTAWTTLVETAPGSLLSACTALTDPSSSQVQLLVSTVSNGVPRLCLHDLTGRKLTDITTPGSGPGSISALSTPPGDTDRLWFTYTDFTTPPAVHRLTLPQGQCQPETGHPPAGSTSPSRHERPAVRQVTYRSADGTPVSLYLIAPAADHDGPRPALLTAYGGFGASAAPAYSPTITAWVRAGGIYAVAAIRGGGEQGTTWHAAGQGHNKPNAFADFAAAARYLIDHQLTTPAQLAIKGASHSGLTVAVAFTRDPGLYAAAVCSDALTDMVRYPRFGLGAWWTKEFGTPDDPAQLDTLLSYSPYHNVRPGTRYPAILLTSPRTDPRVGAAHMRKFAAALQQATTSGKPVLLRTEDGVGHGPRAVSRYTPLQSDALAFCAHHTGLLPASNG